LSLSFCIQAQGTGPEEVELDVADNDFLAAMLAVIEAHGQVSSVKISH
jgi:hypothetical protein